MNNNYSLPGIMVLLLPFGTMAQSMRITPGCKVVATGAVNIVLDNTGFVNDGGFMAGNSTVLFTGNADTRIAAIGGTSVSAFNHVTISKSSGDITLNQHMVINGTLTMNSGNVQLNGQTLNLDSTGRIASENNRSRIIGINGGRVLVTRTFVANTPLNPGNIGAELLIESITGSTVGIFTIERTHVPEALPGPVAATGIQRNFTISGLKPAVVKARLRFFYLDGELNGNDEPSLSLFSGPRPGGVLINIGRDEIDVNGNVVTKLNIDPMAHFTLGSSRLANNIPLTLAMEARPGY